MAMATPAKREAAGGSGASEGGGRKKEMVGLEQFLPRRSLRVLLVEGDDSTRHIVAALLRKCAYRVAAVADGMKAWEVMQERHYSFDLVLTEVVMPSLSGIGLLSKIVAANECKNIPVIMMSSQDSIGVVLKCMLKGAVDFLVKPVRKNELRNLWQHVWRRHCSNASENNAASNNMSGNARAAASNNEKNSDDTDAQNSGSKPEMEIQSVRRQSDESMDEARNSFREVEAKKEQPEDIARVAENSNVMKEDCSLKTADGLTAEINRSSKKASFSEKHPGNDCSYSTPIRAEEQQGTLSCHGDVNPKPSHHNDSISKIMYCNEPIAAQRCTSAALDRVTFQQDGHSETSSALHAKGTSDPGPSPLLELSLRRPQISGFVSCDFKEKRILRHSNSSAFSRWHSDKRMQHTDQEPVSSPFHLQTRESINNVDSNIGSLASFPEVINSLSSEKRVPVQEKTVEGTSYFPMSFGSNKEDICLASSNQGENISINSPKCSDSFCHPQFGFISAPNPAGPTPYQNFPRFGAAFQPIHYPELSFHANNSTSFEKTSAEFPSTQHSKIDNHSTDILYCDKYHCHLKNQQSSNWKQQIDVEPGHPEDASSTPIEEVNLRASCSKDFQKVTGGNAYGETTDDAANLSNALESGNESGIQKCSRKVEGEWSRREAALMKFRLKRKDRCFEKKVRYHSRKKLAEQRPRVKGQFVLQKLSSPSTATEAEG